MNRKIVFQIFKLALPLAILATRSEDLLAQVPSEQTPLTAGVRPLELRQTRYTLRAGESVQLDAPSETVDFITKAKKRSVTIKGPQGKGLVVGPGVNGGIFLAASLRVTQGEYAVTISARSESGEERVTTLAITLNPMAPVPANAARPPVILLNGWQAPFFGTGQFQLNTCSPQPLSGTFGAGFDTFLMAGTGGSGAPIVYWFDNCVECWNCKVEDLGAALQEVIDMIQYTTGQPVPQLDLVAHSMGGLIIRSYVSGLQANGIPSPPISTKVRKVIEIATPNFGAFLIDKVAKDLVLGAFLLGIQSQELRSGSQFLWNLATWNQGGDDLRGTDAIAIIGNRGVWPSPTGSTWSNASDGVVSVTSASLGFARDASRTILLPYCHVDSPKLAMIPAYQYCAGDPIGVAKAQDTWDIVNSFLADTPQWKTSSQSSLGPYGGLYAAAESAAPTLYSGDLSTISFEALALEKNPVWNFYSADFLPAGSGLVQFSSPTLGNGWQTTRTVPSGTFAALRLKLGPYIGSVGPLLSSTAKVVASGSTITLSGYGFGQQCAACSVIAGNNQSLPISSWTDQAIKVSLPAYSGIVGLTVNASNGHDAINFMAAPPSVAPAPPFGSFDTPASGSSTSGALAVTGWALSQSGIAGVNVYREPNPGETPGANGLMLIGAATLVPGARPDVLGSYPSYPGANQAGWGLQLLTNELPGNSGLGIGNGAYKLHAIAAGNDGQSTDLGTKLVTVNNSTAKLPFGTIDTPAQGGVASGSAFVNFGWALTPLPNTIPSNGSTIMVYIDGSPVGHPVYNQYRADIATLFPGYNNSGGAVGYFVIDTTKFTNGFHTIAWGVVDGAGNAQGIGSRFFTVQN